MEKTRVFVKRAGVYLRRNWFVFFAMFVYALFTVYYMGPSITACSTTTYGFGDNTAGPIWKATLPESQGLIGSQTSMTNAPYGDVLENPIAYSLILQILLIQGSQAVGGAVCGYNMVNAFSFFLSALVMFGFIFALTRNRWIALLAGYAVTFTPYYQMKVGGHPSYGFQAIFIGIIWLFYRVITYRKKRDAILLGLLFGVAVYFDPYFSLFVMLLLASLGISWLVLSRQVFQKSFWQEKKESIKKSEFKNLLLAAGVAVVTVIPLVAIYAVQYQQINANVAASRGNVIMEAKACSNWPHEYLTPFVLHPLFQNIVGSENYTKIVDYLKDSHSCGIGEDSVGLSVTLVAITGLGLIIFAWEKLNKRRLNLSTRLYFNPKLVVTGMILLAIIAIAFALPPVRLKGIIPTPAYLLLDITETWRTLTRFYMLVNISLVVLVSVVFTYVMSKFGHKYKKLLAILLVGVFIAVFVEYQAFRPLSGNTLSTFSYATDAPSAYSWLKLQSGIVTIAEYPLEQYGKESDAMSYYLTMQVIHKKKLFNSALSYGPQETYKDSLKNLADPQTLTVLRSQGVDAVVVHGVPEAKLRQIYGDKVVFTAPQARFNINSHSPVVKEDNVVILSLKNIPTTDYYLDLGNGFARNTTIINSVIDWKYEAISGAELLVQGLRAQKITSNTHPVQACFSVQMSVPDEITNLRVIIDGEAEQELGVITGVPSHYAVTAQRSIKLVSVNGHNMRVTGLGCQNE